jgi:hypothetical protein
MKIKSILAVVAVTALTYSAHAQSISTETVNYKVVKSPKTFIEESQRKLKVTVTSPYNVTTEQVVAQHKADFENQLKNFDKTVAESEALHQQKLKDYDKEVINAKEKFETESAEFKKLSLLERLAMTEQGKNPKMATPSKPVYYAPQKPVYREPNLNEHIIVNNEVLSTQINVEGFTRDGNNLEVAVDIKKLTFQDNNGQTFANQPTKVIAKVNGVEKLNATYFQEFKMVASSPSNNINQPLTEKNFLNEVIAHINSVLNDNFAVQSMNRTMVLATVKNNKGKYDDLEKASIYVATNLKKLNPQNAEMNQAAIAGLQKGIDIWKATIDKVNFKDKKADFNAKIGEMVYFNLMRINLALNNKKEAENWLNAMQENLIYMDLSYDSKNALKSVESEIYNAK